ncbi:MAG: sulfotransferase [Gemmatimonadetes bacterium]|nr:sulfotransferase [Gemmatimonadota bacterium]
MKPADLSRVIRHVPVLLFGRPLHGQERYRPFFIVGSGRCGSTLLRAMLEAHPDIHVPPETHALGCALRAYRRYSRLPWATLLRVVLTHFQYHRHWDTFEMDLGLLYRELAVSPPEARNLATVLNALYRAHAALHKPSAIRWGDKTPANTYWLPQLRSAFPDLRVIHMVRDGRDVVGSFLRLNQLDLIPASEFWSRAVRTAQTFGVRHPAQYLEVRYERLVTEPRAVVQQVAGFLDFSLDERMLRHHELGLRLGDVERMPHLQGVRQPIYRTAAGRWRSELNAGQIVQIERLLGPMLASLGYLEGDAHAEHGADMVDHGAARS